MHKRQRVLARVRTDEGVIGALHDPRNCDLDGPEADVEAVL